MTDESGNDGTEQATVVVDERRPAPAPDDVRGRPADHRRDAGRADQYGSAVGDRNGYALTGEPLFSRARPTPGRSGFRTPGGEHVARWSIRPPRPRLRSGPPSPSSAITPSSARRDAGAGRVYVYDLLPGGGRARHRPG